MYKRQAPVVEVSGRTFPVEVRYRPSDGSDEGETLPGLLGAVDELRTEPGTGDMLVFLPGERDIREAAALIERHAPELEVLPLFARLSAAEQDRVFHPGRAQRVVLATNIAETSLTVPGIRFVIDTGRARISRYSYRSKIQRLQIEPISQASALQRQGRCGRLRDGVCIRLYDEEDFEARPTYTDPEILRTNLASVILAMADLKLGHVEDFPFLDPPDPRFVRDGYRLLGELGAVDDGERVTRRGHAMARLPVDPRLARILLAGDEQRCLEEALVIVSLLGIRDPRDRPLDKAAQADEKHAAWQMPNSDFQTALTFWRAVHEQRRDLSGNRFRRWCKEHFLSYLRVREWHDVHTQLRAQCVEMKLRPNEQPADYASLHRALLCGFLGHIGQRDDERRFRGPRNRSFVIGPGSVVHQKPPRWVVAAALVETTRVYAHTAAKVEPRWIEEAAGDLVKRSYEDPHWDATRGHAVARETVSLYGLVLSSGRRVDFGRVDPVAARRLFVTAALVNGEHELEARFVRHNAALRDRVRAVEHRLRRRDLLADDRRQAEFFEARVPASIVDVRGFERWRRKAEAGQPDLLCQQLEDLLAADLPTPDPADWPDELAVEGNRLALSYRFEPGAEDDGVTVAVPATLLPMVDDDTLDWLVPGLLEEKVTALIRALPTAQRRRLVPAPDVGRRCVAGLEWGLGSLRSALARLLTREGGAEVSPDAWREASLPPHLEFSVAVINETGDVVARGRDPGALRARFGKGGPVAAGDADRAKRMTDWEAGDLPRTVQVRDAAGSRHLYPALRDEGETVTLRYYADRTEAERVHAGGVLRLAVLALAQPCKYLRKTFGGRPELALGAAYGTSGSLVDDLVRRTIADVMQAPDDPPIRREEEFRRRLDERRSSVVLRGSTLAELVVDILQRRQALAARLDEGLKGPGAAAAAEAIREQLAALVPAGFLRTVPAPWLGELPRYLRAAEARIDKLATGNARDAQMEAQVTPFEARLSTVDDAEAQPELTRYRWLIEEFRVSLFAQSLGTREKVSAARLEQQWQRVLVAARRAH